MRRQPGENRRARRPAHRAGGVGAIKPHALLCQPIQVGRAERGVTGVGPEHKGALGIDQKEDGLAWHGGV